ncbi:MAG: DNA-directed RNA polymerase subunit omega [Clostridiales bacterium]|nr:DNA-directed RNA polymerase subunit omega [Clostridiales bacterium]
MLNPDLRKLLSNHLSRYSLVTAVAKRARIIAEEAEEKKIVMTEKPVSVAVEEILRSDYIIVEPEEIRNL